MAIRRIIVGLSPTTPPPAPIDQGRIIQELLSAECITKGDRRMVISLSWWRKWETYVRKSSGPLRQIWWGTPPGPIDNSDLLEGDGNLNENLVSGIHYKHVSEKMWDKLSTWHGSQPDQSVIPRQIVIATKLLLSLYGTEDEDVREAERHKETWNIPDAAVKVYQSESLGKGSSASIFWGRWRHATVAVKVYHKVLNPSAYYSSLFRQEMSVSSCLRHPNVVTVFGASTDPMQIVMELMEGSLDDLIAEAKRTSYLTLREQIDLALDLLAGVNYLHQVSPFPYIHCDIRSSNALVAYNMQLKLGDLGAAHKIEEKDVHGQWTSAGPMSPNYCAPERVRGEKSTKATDVYSLGITISEIFTGLMADGKERSMKSMKSIENPKLKRICKNMASIFVIERPSVDQVLTNVSCFQLEKEYENCPPKRYVRGRKTGNGQRLELTCLQGSLERHPDVFSTRRRIKKFTIYFAIFVFPVLLAVIYSALF
eukprot:m.207080 g.207080  ORF g.207080 m.207080 type:complete len:482 (+) comp39690_c0_seq3:25-1470(+)